MDYERIKSQFPTSSMKISNLLKILIYELEEIKEILKDPVSIKEIDDLLKDLDELKEGFFVEQSQLSILEGKEDYIFDPNRPHYILEDFTYTTPSKFIFIDKEVKVDSHKDMYIKILREFNRIDSKKFKDLTRSKDFNGEKIKYFNTSKKDLRRPHWIGPGIYGDTNFSANGFRDMIIKFVKKMGIEYEDIKIYLSRNEK